MTTHARLRSSRPWALLGLIPAMLIALIATAPPAAAQPTEQELDELKARLTKEVDERLADIREEMLEEIDRTIERIRQGRDRIERHVPRNLRPEIRWNSDEPGYLGLKAENIDPAIAELMDLPDTKGVYVTEVLPGTPAAKAGVKAVDVLLEFNGEKLENLDHLKKLVAARKSGEEITLLVLGEDGRRRKVSVTLGSRNGGPMVSLPERPESVEDLEKLLEDAFARGDASDGEVEDMFGGMDPEQMKRMQEAMRKMLDGEEFEVGEMLDGLLEGNPELKKQLEGMFGPDADLDEIIKQFLPEGAEEREQAIRDALKMLGESDNELGQMLEDLLDQVRPPKAEGTEKAEPGDTPDTGEVGDLVEDMLGPGAAPAAREKGFLGVRPSAAANDAGVVIDIVFPDTPAEAAGLKAGDIITRVGGAEVKGLDTLGGALGKSFAGDKVAIDILRDGKKITLTVTLGARPAPATVAPPIGPGPVRPIPVEPPSTGKPTLGFSAADAAGGGLDVRGLTDGGPAAKAGLKIGDRVTEIDGMEIVDRDSLRLVLGALKPGQTVPMTIVRNGKEMKLTVTVGAR